MQVKTWRRRLRYDNFASRFHSIIRNVMTQKQNSYPFMIFFLGLLSAFGPFVMDMYLPTLPSMTDYFSTTLSMVQLGLTASMVGLAGGQLLFGPLSDKYGRKPVLLVSLGLFLLSTLGCLFAVSISQFVIMRLLQGTAGAGGVVLSRSIATDRYLARELASTLAVIGAINGTATVAAPLLGGVLASFTDWHGIFWSLFVLGILLMVGSLRFCESLPAVKRVSVNWQDVGRNLLKVLRNRRYVHYVCQYGCTMGVLFVNIASAPFLMQKYYGLNPMEFSVCFGANAVAMAIASAACAKFSSQRALSVSCRIMPFLSVLLCVLLCIGCPFWIYEILLFFLLSVVGMAFTASNTLAMDCERNNAGMASALLGAIGFAIGGIVSPLVGIGNIRYSAGLLFIACSVGAYCCARRGLVSSVSIRPRSIAVP